MTTGGKPVRLGIDMDGVLADFNTSFYYLLAEMCGRSYEELPEGWQPEVWAWPSACGFPQTLVEEAWLRLAQPGQEFWYDLSSYPEANEFLKLLEMLVNTHKVEAFFPTRREGWKVKFWTERWLQERGLEVPTVLPVHSDVAKGTLAEALALDHLIDDKPENVYAVRAAAPRCQVALLARPWNAPVREDCQERGIVIYDSVLEWLLQAVGLEEKERAS